MGNMMMMMMCPDARMCPDDVPGCPGSCAEHNLCSWHAMHDAKHEKYSHDALRTVRPVEG
jgi:hypothetical protein